MTRKTSTGDHCVYSTDYRYSSQGDSEMMSLIRIRQSNLAGLLVWLAAAWLFFVVIEIDRFHNGNGLARYDACVDPNCHEERPNDNHHSSVSLILPSQVLSEQDTDCAACRLWTVLSSTDFVNPEFGLHDYQISQFISSEVAVGPVAALIVCLGRSPPVFS